MRECLWCGRQNLNVYSYCQTCGRGFDGPEKKEASPGKKRKFWPFGSSQA